VKFDIANHQVIGRSQIELAAGEESEISLQGMRINIVKINGNPAIEQVEDDILYVSASSTPQVITIYYSKEFSPDRRMSDGFITQSGIALTGQWHPILNRDCLFQLSALIPSEFEAIAEADSIHSEMTGGKKKTSFTLSQPLRSLTLIAGPYEVKKNDFGQDKELYSYFFNDDSELADHYLEKARGYLQRYEALLGEYPYKRFSIVENRLPTGFAVPTFTLLGQAVIRLPFIVDTSLGHEILHAWLGNSIRTDLKEGNWSEGLTTYLADHAFKEDQGKGAEFRKGQMVKYQSHVLHDNNLTLNDFMGGVSHLEKNQETRRAIGYNKASMVFHMLRNTIGQDNFNNGLRSFVSQYRYKKATWSDLAASFKSHSSIDLQVFFDQWLTRADLPMLEVRDVDFETEDGQTILTLTVTQATESPYTLRIPLDIKTITGEIFHHQVDIAEKENKIRLQVQAEPTEVVIDPQYDVLRHLTTEELPPVWSRFQGASDRIVVHESKEFDEKVNPLVNQLQKMKCRFVLESEITDEEISNASLLFLNAQSPLAKSLFASNTPIPSGFTLDVRPNPLNPEHVAVLISSQDSSTASIAVRKLKHYAKYSFLHFADGRLQEKRIRSSELGQRIQLIPPPHGIRMQESMSYDKIMADLSESRVIYVGEKHENYSDHRLQFNIIRDLFNRNPKLAIGMEMFTMPTQDALNRFLAGEINERTFLKESHYFKIWGFDYRFFREILNFARENKIPVVALNLEKKTVSSVFKNGGISSLEDDIRSALPPERDLDMPGYRERINMAFGAHGPHSQKMGSFGNFLQAQALWDETMADNIASFLTENPEHRMVVLAGRGHCDKANAIPPRVSRRIDVPQRVIFNNDATHIAPEDIDYLLFTTPAQLPPSPRLGVYLKEVNNQVSVAGLSPHGVAGAAGIKKGDIILSLDNENISSVEDIKIHLLYKKKKDKITILLKRIYTWWPDQEIEMDLIL